MPTPITLSLAQVKEAGRKAYLEGRLSAQVTRNHIGKCKYRDLNGAPCVIGASLTDAQARRFDKRASSAISDLVAENLVKTNDLSGLCALQSAHDMWSAGYPARQAELRELLGIEEAA